MPAEEHFHAPAVGEEQMEGETPAEVSAPNRAPKARSNGDKARRPAGGPGSVKAPRAKGSPRGGSRRKSREMALQMLFQSDVGKQTAEQVEKSFWDTRDDVDAETRGFAQDLFRVAMTRAETVDRLIETHAKNWRLERMPAVDRNLLRMAVAEMLGFPRTPGPIIINEALEVGRIYAAPESMPFLNGMLDAIGQSLKVPAVQGAAARAHN